MTVTRDSLVVAYPEFGNAPTAMVDAQIANATLCNDSDVYGDRYDLAVLLMACHLIAVSPWGEKLKLSPTKGVTAYLEGHQRLEAAAGAAWRMPA